MTDLTEQIISDWEAEGLVQLGRAPEYPDDQFFDSRTIVYDAAMHAVQTLSTYLDKLAACYPADIFPAESTSKEAIAGTALRTVLTAQAKALRGEV